ncbi:MAG TPA: hypothetical protein VMU24_05765 [Candidatus Acidoferrales bacterium]|nr:hypothetical protein [Candidatus Acidoferrales bacterium]
MLRVECEEHGNTLAVQLQGRFVANFAEDAMATLTRFKNSPNITVDLSDITFVDEAGESVLLWMRTLGANFIAEQSYALSICERLHLPLVDKSARFTGCREN